MKMEKERYKVSIILPVYNGEKYLSLAIESILKQTYKNFELIIIDDCSSDQTHSIALKYKEKDSRVRVYRNKTNSKLPVSLNAGFHVATGELFTWTSDDNILKPETIETMVHVFEQDPNVDFVYADIIPIDEDGKINRKIPYLNGEIDEIYVRNPILACFLYKRHIHDCLKGYNPNTFLYEDYDFWIRTYEAGFKIHHLKKKMYYYRIHKKSLTSLKEKELLQFKIKLLKRNFGKTNDKCIKIKILKHLQEIYYQQNRIDKYIFFILYRKAMEYFNMGIRDKNRNILDQSKKCFDKLADLYEFQSWFSEPEKCYQPVIEIVKTQKGTLRLLDLGCGNGIVLKRVCDELSNVEKALGIDLSPNMVEKAKERLYGCNCNVIEGTIESVKIKPNYYKMVLCMHSFHHYPKPLRSLKHINKAMEKNGLLILADNKKNGFERWNYNWKLMRQGYPDGDMWIYSKLELLILGKMAGFKMESFQNVGDKSFITIFRKHKG